MDDYETLNKCAKEYFPGEEVGIEVFWNTLYEQYAWCEVKRYMDCVSRQVLTSVSSS